MFGKGSINVNTFEPGFPKKDVYDAALIHDLSYNTNCHAGFHLHLYEMPSGFSTQILKVQTLL